MFSPFVELDSAPHPLLQLPALFRGGQAKDAGLRAVAQPERAEHRSATEALRRGDSKTPEA